MTIKIKENNNINFDYLLNISNIFKIDNIDTRFYTQILEFYKNDKLIGIVNYCILASINKEKIYIRHIYYTKKKYLDLIIKEFCNYYNDKNKILMTNIKTNLLNNDIVTILQKNNFIGKEYLFYTY